MIPSPRVSVLTTVFNGMPFIRQAALAVLAQDYSNLELVVVDDGSTDSTAEFFQTLGDKRVKFIQKGKLGRGKALNEGLANCSGKYVAVNDADDVSLPGRLEKQIAFLESHPEHGLVGSNFVKAFPSGKKEVSDKPLDDATLRIRLSKHSCIQHSCVMFRKEVLDKIGGYNLAINFLYDRDIYIRVAQVSKIANLPEVLVEINRHDKQYFLSTFKGFQRRFHTLKYNFIAIDRLRLPKWLYPIRLAEFGVQLVQAFVSNLFTHAKS